MGCLKGGPVAGLVIPTAVAMTGESVRGGSVGAVVSRRLAQRRRLLPWGSPDLIVARFMLLLWLFTIEGVVGV
jgi:hypothetical protein